MSSAPVVSKGRPSRRIARALAGFGLFAIATFVLTQSWPVIGIALQGGPDDELGFLTAISALAVLLWAALLWAAAVTFGVRRARAVVAASVVLAIASMLWAAVAIAAAPLGVSAESSDMPTFLRFFSLTGWTLPAGCISLLASGVIWLTARS